MAKTFEQLLQGLREKGGGAVLVNLVTNQDTGAVSYARGTLYYTPPADGRGERLATRSRGIPYFFNDRKGTTGRQPFSPEQVDRLGFALEESGMGDPGAGLAVEVTLQSWGNGRFPLLLEQRNNVYIGVGHAIGNGTNGAVYTISFGEGVPFPEDWE